MAALLDHPFYPWQRQVADVGMELGPDGRLAYRELIVTVPRQNGKTSLVLSLELDRCVAWGRPQRVVYTAQTGREAAEKLLDDQLPIIQRSPVKAAVEKVVRVNGGEGVKFRGGSRIDVQATTESAGHGKVTDLGVIDEAFKDVDARREQAILPGMVTKPDAQLLVVSTVGTDASLYLNPKIETGRAATLRDTGSGIAYFEWSAPPDADIDDPEVWWSAMPALGHGTYGLDAVRHARQTMSDDEFRRAFLNIPTGRVVSVIPAEAWDAVCDPSHAPAGDRLHFAVDVLPERDGAAIAVSDGETVELVGHAGGIAWCTDQVRELRGRWPSAVWTVDGGGPASSLTTSLQLTPMGNADVVAACANFFDAVADATVKVRRSDPLDRAVRGAAKRQVGDRWVWSRNASTEDVTPLMAASLALHSARAARARATARPSVMVL